MAGVRTAHPGRTKPGRTSNVSHTWISGRVGAEGEPAVSQLSLSLTWPEENEEPPDLSCGRQPPPISACVNWQLCNVNRSTAVLSGRLYFCSQRQVLEFYDIHAINAIRRRNTDIRTKMVLQIYFLSSHTVWLLRTLGFNHLFFSRLSFNGWTFISWLWMMKARAAVFLANRLRNSADIWKPRSRKLLTCGDREPIPDQYLLTSPIVLQRLQYFHKLWKDNLVLDSQYWVISRDPLLAMYYSRVFKPHSGPGRKCSLPASVTGYQPLIYYSTCWSKATQSNSLWCCLDRREECWTTEAAWRPLVFSLFPKGQTEGVAGCLCRTAGLEITRGRKLRLLDSC